MKNSIFYILFLGFGVMAQAQFTHADTLRGMLLPERTCYNVHHYDLNIAIDFDKKTIRGYNRIGYKVERGFNMLQLDLFDNMVIDSVMHAGEKAIVHRKGNAFFVDLGTMQEEDILDELTVYYHGKPRVAIQAPWDGGFSWKQDQTGKPWLGVSCEGIGASLWWPNKDHLSDEPDSMRIRCTVPQSLICVSNGVLHSKTPKANKQMEYDWRVSYPINNYNVTLNVADYVHFSDTFISPTDGSKLAMDYYVLPYNFAKAKKQFKQAHDVLAVFEKYLGKYPFWEDGYALVETPYLGMEHQGAIAYGNKYLPGYLGRHPQGVPEDFIILHETGHEWWGNSVSCQDHGEMWIHETFCTYMEAVYVEEMYNYDKAEDYLEFHSSYIENNQPMLGPLNVNYDKHDSDMYYKGAMMLHTLRKEINNDSLWWDILKTFYQQQEMKPTVSEDYIKLVNKKTGKDYTCFFDQYLKHSTIPQLHYKLGEKKNKVKLSLKWVADVPGFDFHPELKVNSRKMRVEVNDKNWTTIWFSKKEIQQLELGTALYQMVLLE